MAVRLRQWNCLGRLPSNQTKNVLSMLTAMGDTSFEVTRIDSKNELKEQLAQCQWNTLLIDEGGGTDCHMVTLRRALTEKPFLSLGLCCVGFGIQPQMLLLAPVDVLLLGFDSQVVSVNLPKREIDYAVELETPFYCFVQPQQPGLVVVVYETGAMGLNYEGKQVWHHDIDVVTDYSMDNDEKLKLIFMDSPPIYIDMLTGAIHR